MGGNKIMDNYNVQQLQARVATLETQVDMLETELSFLDEMLIRCGFPKGIHTLKDTVEELLSEEAFLSNQEKPERI